MLTDFWRLPRSQDGYLYANTQAMATSFKNEVLLGAHQFGAVTLVSRGSLTSPTKDSFKAALYLASASLGAATTAYSATGEVSGTGYTAGGIAVTNGTDPTTSGTTAFWTPSASLVYYHSDSDDIIRCGAHLQLDPEQPRRQRAYVWVSDGHRWHVHVDDADERRDERAHSVRVKCNGYTSVHDCDNVIVMDTADGNNALLSASIMANGVHGPDNASGLFTGVTAFTGLKITDDYTATLPDSYRLRNGTIYKPSVFRSIVTTIPKSFKAVYWNVSGKNASMCSVFGLFKVGPPVSGSRWGALGLDSL
jgi:hypothetical protein